MNSALYPIYVMLKSKYFYPKMKILKKCEKGSFTDEDHLKRFQWFGTICAI